MSAYETWQEAKRRLRESAEPEGEYYSWLTSVEETSRPIALKDWIERHAGLNGSEEPLEVDADEIAEFLAGLDEIRGTPRSGELEAQKDDLFNRAIGQVSRMERLNWTGDHTYKDALDDVRVVLLSVWEGKPFPKLERFRCPSIKLPKASDRETYQCHLQLPHEGEHVHKTIRWTDEQSANPPKNYDPPTELCGANEVPRPGVIWCCDRDKGHSGQHVDGKAEKAWNPEIVPTDAQLDKLAEEVFGNPDPINRPEPYPDENTAQERAYCSAQVLFRGVILNVCDRVALHTGRHHDPEKGLWG